MRKKTLSPAVLAALGLTGCIDSCNPLEPLEFFRDGDDDEVHPCLSMVVEPDPEVEPPVHPCLSPPRPPPDPPIGPCLKIAPPRVGPCLRMVMPRPVTQPAPSPGMDLELEVGPCLTDPFEPAIQPPEGDPSGSAHHRSDDVVAKLISEGLLSADVVERLHKRN